MKHIFDVDIAKEYGIEEAVILENIHHWIRKNAANGKHFHNGRYWTYNSAKAFTFLFPYMSERKVRYAISKLLENGLLIDGNFNKMKIDRTKWYSLTDKALNLLGSPDINELPVSTWEDCILQNCNDDLTILQNRSNKNVSAIPYINTDIKPNNNNSELPKNQNKKEFVPPTLEEIEAYIKENNFKVNAQEFYRFYSSCNWKDSNERLVKNWKNKMRRVWVKEEPKPIQKQVVSKAEQDVMDKSLSMSFEEEQELYERQLAEQRSNVK